MDLRRIRQGLASPSLRGGALRREHHVQALMHAWNGASEVPKPRLSPAVLASTGCSTASALAASARAAASAVAAASAKNETRMNQPHGAEALLRRYKQSKGGT